MFVGLVDAASVCNANYTRAMKKAEKWRQKSAMAHLCSTQFAKDQLHDPQQIVAVSATHNLLRIM